MAQRLGNIEQWRLLESREDFPGGERPVVLEVNSATACGLYIVLPDGGEDILLARVEGRDRIEFSVTGDFGLYSDGGDLWFFTTDGQKVANHEVAPEVYTKLADRKDRNHNLEAIEWRMRQNVDRRMRELEAEANRRLADVERTYTERAKSKYAPPEPVGEEEDSGRSSGEDDAPENRADGGKAGKDKPPAGAKQKAPATTDDK